ncbi:TKL protein kinase [Saprolegnia diclina VS20]|uniref:TKL protein kinase n=1 Tax=Saprolegnia diclina (strain VS20) TaxID=1156394 RepID=T0REJ7_SAPDV|nr:TKL protein kinase [Saprolegnia diclina VS20]EQC28012.1 TKL protein kinase [Saprolegnia diclina VS20]|eukprot:XP_008618625.1 TKL protein kinase [Saprolegnia diclina VS20]
MRGVVFVAALVASVAADCASLKAAYTQTAATCQAAIAPKNITLGMGAQFCNETTCAAAVTSAAAWKAGSCAGTADAINNGVYPTSYCTDSCQKQLSAYGKRSTDCTAANTTFEISSCTQCANIFAAHPNFQQVCGINFQNADDYINQFLAQYASSIAYCKVQFPSVVFPSPPQPASSGSTTTYIGIGAGVVVLILLIVAFIVYRRRQKAASKSSNHTGTGYYSNNASSQFTHPNATNGGAVADDIRFDMDLARFRVPQQEIQNIQLLVKGGYGVVFKATLHGTDVAMKQLLPSKAKDHNAIQEFMNEIRLCARLEHPKIVKFVGISWSTLHDLAVLSEFMPHGDVTDLLKAERKRPKKERVFHWLPSGAHATTKTAVAADVADALCFLHSFQPTIIHRDLKSKNVLLSATWEAKLSDFGISRVTSNEETMTSNIGTVAWIAPEVLTGGHYSEKADIYSFGVFLSEMDTLESPYSNLTEQNQGQGFSNARIAMMVSEGALKPSFTDNIPGPLLALAMRCLAFYDIERPSARVVADELRRIMG